MAEVKHYLDYEGTDELWRRIVKLCNKKLDSVENLDDSIKVVNKKKIAVKISNTEDNMLELQEGKGLYVKPSTMHTLTFGADEEYKYDGSKDVIVPVYMGEIE